MSEADLLAGHRNGATSDEFIERIVVTYNRLDADVASCVNRFALMKPDALAVLHGARLHFEALDPRLEGRLIPRLTEGAR